MSNRPDALVVSSGEEEDVDDANLPSREECESRCQAFAAVTETDTTLAMFYLQERDWDLDRAVSAFFEDTGRPLPDYHPQSAATGTGSGSAPVPKNASKTPSQSSQSAATMPTPSARVYNSRAAALDPEPHRIRLMTWNIDGLDKDDVIDRAKAVCDVIRKERPHAVFLQEVVAGNQAVVEEALPEYDLVVGGHKGYYTAMLFRRGEVMLEDSTVTAFPTTRMSRNLLTVQCKIKGVPMQLMTSHLESMKDHSEERLRQFRMSLETVQSSQAERTVIFGGDLNLRDKEAAQANIPEDICDLWEVMGKRYQTRFTWDMKYNDNKEFEDFDPRFRFDRLYLRDSRPHRQLQPVCFELVGQERLASCDCFPSDHWGILTHFNIEGVEVRGQRSGTAACRERDCPVQ